MDFYLFIYLYFFLYFSSILFILCILFICILVVIQQILEHLYKYYSFGQDFESSGIIYL